MAAPRLSCANVAGGAVGDCKGAGDDASVSVAKKQNSLPEESSVGETGGGKDGKGVTKGGKSAKCEGTTAFSMSQCMFRVSFKSPSGATVYTARSPDRTLTTWCTTELQGSGTLCRPQTP